MNFISKLFASRHNVTKIVSGFQKTVDKLAAAQQHHVQKSIDHENEAAAHHAQARLATIESEIARKIKAKLEELIA